uniref:BTB domain-containing protein n=1 Tax=Meloidogyne enterolobii TaxID=390850 RepID=A0A6V7UUP3_MELEN|nr:unnamed protein product [Meloidogyne enterolobii]
MDMFKHETFTDCVIEIGDEKINAHRSVLAQNSKVFYKMLEQEGMIEAQNGEIKVVDCSFECFRAMIEYFYSGEIDKIILKNSVIELFGIAHKYEVINLMEICERFMISNIDATNFNVLCNCIELYSPPKLEEVFKNIIRILKERLKKEKINQKF